MNYRELAELILATPEIQDQDVTVFVPGVDEYYPGTVAFTDDSCNVLDDGHMVITLADDEDADAEAAHRANNPNAY
jgi:hypothetical protein